MSFTTRHSPNVFLNHTIPVKIPQTIYLKIWKQLLVEAIACGISWRECSTKKPHSLGFPFFGLGMLHTMESRLKWPSVFSRISKINLEISVDYIQMHFLNNPPGFFCETRTSSKYWPRTSSWTSPNKIWYILHPKDISFSSFPIICMSSIWKSLFYQNKSYLRHFSHLEGSWLNFISSFCQQILLCADYSLVYFMKK